MDRCRLRWGSGRGELEVNQGWTDADSGGDLEEVNYKFIRVDRCSLIWRSGRGLLEVYQGLTDVDSAGDLEEVY